MALTITPNLYLYRHQRGGVPGMNLMIHIDYGDSWTLHNDSSMLFTLNGEILPEITGSGSESILIGITNHINQYDEGIYEMTLRAFNSNSTEEDIIQIILFVTDTEDDLVLPKNLTFEAVRNVKIAEEQTFYIASSQSGITINLPVWIELVSHDLIGGGHIVTVKPVAQNFTPNKKYEDEIELLIPGDNPQSLAVEYTIHAGYDESFTKEVHFSDDNEELIFYKTTPENTFLKLLIDVIVYDYSGMIVREFPLELDFPFVQFRAKVNLGKELNDYFPEISNFNYLPKIKGVYPPIEIRLTALEIQYSDFSIVNEDILPLQYFLKGRNPLRSKKISQAFWADFRPSFLRMISPESVVSISFFKPAMKIIDAIVMKINGEFYKNIPADGQAFGIRRPYFCTATISLPNLLPGDEVSFEYPGISVAKTFIINSHPKEINRVAYLTPH